jgi:dinuclear metal center YbgI/SA1388 family protein
MTVQEIYQYINELAPFDTQEKWDNSGLLVGNGEQEVFRVMVTLDISSRAVCHAEKMGCNLIISHHPVIFSPLHTLPQNHPVYRMAAAGIAAICSHTSLDIADGGVNDILIQRLGEYIPFTQEKLSSESSGFCRILHLRNPLSAGRIAEKAGKALECRVVRYFDAMKDVEKLGICSGSGASLLEELQGKCDCLLTGDVKHDRWIVAENMGISLIDCGHYHTEVLMVNALTARIRMQFPQLEVIPWEGGDPVEYVC